MTEPLDLDAIEAQHVPDVPEADPQWCADCGEDMPCSTVGLIRRCRELEARQIPEGFEIDVQWYPANDGERHAIAVLVPVPPSGEETP